MLHAPGGAVRRPIVPQRRALARYPGFRARLNELTGGWTVPQIVIGDRPIGGYTELWRLDREGLLDELVAA